MRQKSKARAGSGKAKEKSRSKSENREKTQSERFIETAQSIGVDEAEFESALRKIVPARRAKPSS